MGSIVKHSLENPRLLYDPLYNEAPSLVLNHFGLTLVSSSPSKFSLVSLYLNRYFLS